MLIKIIFGSLALLMLPVQAQTLCNVEVSVREDRRTIKLDFGAHRNLKLTKKNSSRTVFKLKQGELTYRGKPMDEFTAEATDIIYAYDDDSSKFCGIWVEYKNNKYILKIEEYIVKRDQQAQLLTESLDLEGFNETF